MIDVELTGDLDAGIDLPEDALGGGGAYEHAAQVSRPPELHLPARSMSAELGGTFRPPTHSGPLGILCRGYPARSKTGSSLSRTSRAYDAQRVIASSRAADWVR